MATAERSEFETIAVTNPIANSITVHFNSEPYTFAPGETKSYPYLIAYHLAKHISDIILGDEIEKIRAKKKKEKNENPFNPEVGQLLNYDNVKRRIALYTILKKKDEVSACVERCFNFKGTIGTMDEYDAFVTKSEQ